MSTLFLMNKLEKLVRKTEVKDKNISFLSTH